MDQLLLTTEQCSRATGICRSLIEQAVHDGELPALRASGRVLIWPDQLQAWAEKLDPAAVQGPLCGPRDDDSTVEVEIPSRQRDLERWREIWAKATVLDRNRYTLTRMVVALRRKGR